MIDEQVNIIDPDNIVYPGYRSPDPLPTDQVPVLEFNTPSGETEAASESPTGS